MAILKYINFIAFGISILFLSCSDNIRSNDNQNFSLIRISNCKMNTSDIKLVFCKKQSNFKIKTKEFYSSNFFSVYYPEKKILNIKLNFDNSNK